MAYDLNSVKQYSINQIFEICDIFTTGDPFSDSCRIAIKRSEMFSAIGYLSNQLDRNFLSDNQYVENFFNNNYKKMSGIAIFVMAFFLVPPFIVFSIALGLTISGILAVLGVALSIAMIPLIVLTVNSKRKKKVYAAAYESLDEYKKERDDFYNVFKTQAENRLALVKIIYSKLTDYLNSFQNTNRNCVPSAYWCDAAELLHIYESRQADNLKEALQVLENMKHRQRMEDHMELMNAEMEYASAVAEETNEYARQAASDAKRASDAAMTSLFLQLFDD